MTVKVVEKSLTTTMEMLNTTHLGRAKGLEMGLKYLLRDIPDAAQVTITVRKFVDEPEGKSK